MAVNVWARDAINNSLRNSTNPVTCKHSLPMYYKRTIIDQVFFINYAYPREKSPRIFTTGFGVPWIVARIRDHR